MLELLASCILMVLHIAASRLACSNILCVGAGVSATGQAPAQASTEAQPKSFGSQASQGQDHGCHSGHPRAVLMAVMQTLDEMPNEFAQGMVAAHCQV